MVHRAPGINDAESKLYKDFDKNGRTSAVESNKAALTGVKNLQTVAYKYESPFVGVEIAPPRSMLIIIGRTLPRDRAVNLMPAEISLFLVAPVNSS